MIYPVATSVASPPLLPLSFRPSPGLSKGLQCSEGAVRSCLCVGSPSITPSVLSPTCFFKIPCTGCCLQEAFPVLFSLGLMASLFVFLLFPISVYFFFFSSSIHLAHEFSDCVLIPLILPPRNILIM